MTATNIERNVNELTKIIRIRKRRNSDTYNWNCNNCGLCCTNIIGHTVLGDFGAFLLPHEQYLFHPKIIRPLYGLGRKGKHRPRPEVVHAYQNISEPCMWYDKTNQKCLIYNRRPLACQAFPLSLTRKGVMLHKECPQVTKLIPNIRPLNPKQLSDMYNEKRACKIMELYFHSVYVLNVNHVDVSQTWFYNFRKEKWFQPSKAKLFELVKATGRIGEIH